MKGGKTDSTLLCFLLYFFILESSFLNGKLYEASHSRNQGIIISLHLFLVLEVWALVH